MSQITDLSLIELDCPFILRRLRCCQITYYFMSYYKSAFVALSVREMISCSLMSLLKPPHDLFCDVSAGLCNKFCV